MHQCAPHTQAGTRARLTASQLMTGSARIRDPHSATVRAIKPVYVKNFNSLARVTTDRAFLARRASPGHEEKAQRPRGGRKCRPAREPCAPTALIKCCTLPLPLQSCPTATPRTLRYTPHTHPRTHFYRPIYTIKTKLITGL